MAAYLAAYTEEAPLAALYLSGRVFPACAEAVLNVGGALLTGLVRDLSGATETALRAAYRRHGDLGAAAADLLAGRDVPASPPLAAIAACFAEVAAASGPEAKAKRLRPLLAASKPAAVKYLVKLITGDLRIGLRESLVEEAIAAAFAETPAAVRRANMLLGDLAATTRLAAAHRLGEARMQLFHPLGMMLASPIVNAAEGFEYITPAQMQVEDKYDGVRAQVHADGDAVKIFSRTFDEISGSYPELVAGLRGFPGAVILDGEIVAWDPARKRALPFTALQRRLGRKQVAPEVARATPVAFIAFDVLFAGELLIERPLTERRERLETVFREHAPPKTDIEWARPLAPHAGQHDLFAPADADRVPVASALVAPVYSGHDAAALDRLFDAAQARGNEGLMLKDAASFYSPGKRGKSWLKLKRELATLDVVVTGVEWGHGKRAHLLSDYTFAVRDEHGRLVNVGKAYSGLTDAEIGVMTGWFQEHTVEDRGHFRTVAPEVVLEVGFNNVMESDRHESGYALRFPRILRIRDDKPVTEIDTVARVRELFALQSRG